MKKVNSSYTRTHFSRLLREVENGASFTILRRGKPVARLVPYAEDSYYEDIVSEFRKVRSHVAAGPSIKELIEEGRRH